MVWKRRRNYSDSLCRLFYFWYFHSFWLFLLFTCIYNVADDFLLMISSWWCIYNGVDDFLFEVFLIVFIWNLSRWFFPGYALYFSSWNYLTPWILMVLYIYLIKKWTGKWNIVCQRRATLLTKSFWHRCFTINFLNF